MAISQRIRVTIRCHVGSFRKELDCALPGSSAFDDVLEEAVGLLGAPVLTGPWEVTTAAGIPIDRTIPLDAALHDGALLLLTPAAAPTPPVVRDSAEALVAAGDERVPQGVAWAWAFAALTGLAVLVGMAVPWSFSLATGLGVACLMGFVLAIWTDPAPFTSAALITLAAAAGWATVMPPLTGITPAIFAATATALTALGACHAAGIVGPRTAGATLTASVVSLASAGGLLMPGAHPTPAPAISGAAAVVIASLILLTAAPGLSTRAAGLTVPRLPTAGQSLAVSDELPDHVDARAHHAGALYEGLLIGVALCLLPAVACLGLTGSGVLPQWGSIFGSHREGSGFAVALLVALLGALVLHAARHARPRAVWALSCMAMAAALAVTVNAALAVSAAGLGTGSSVGISTGTAFAVVTALVVLVAAGTAPLWGPKIPRVEPTTIVWFERAESLAVAACLPLACHLLGLFMLIRGLG